MNGNKICFIITFLLLDICTIYGSPVFAPDTLRNSSVHAKWSNPRIGKLYDRESILDVPITAYENHWLGKILSVSYKRCNTDGTGAHGTDSGYYFYNEQGYLTEQKSWNKGCIKQYAIYSYETGNRIIKADMHFDNDAAETIYQYLYDDKGNRITDLEYDRDMKLISRLTHKYDRNNNETELVKYQDDTHIVISQTYTYDSRNYQVTHRLISSTGLDMRDTVAYNSDGNATLHINDFRKEISKIVSVYDEAGRKIRDTAYSNNKLSEIYVMQYDEWDNVTEQVVYKFNDPAGKVTLAAGSVYEYDNKGNAVKESHYKVEGKTRVMTEMVERRFVYYE